MSNSTYIAGLIAASQMFTFYCAYFNFGFGFVGNLINILVLTKLKVFHSNRCTFYLIAESVVDISQVFFAFLDRFFPFIYPLVWCKLRVVLMQWCRLMLASIVCFTAIDQYLSTNPLPSRRQWSSLTIAHRQIFVSSLVWIIHVIPFAIASKFDPIVTCSISNIYMSNYFTYFFYPFLNGLFPIFIASLFSFLAYRNVRRIIRRQIPIDRRRLDQQLTAMVFARVISFILLQLPFIIDRIVIINTGTTPTPTISYVINVWAQRITYPLVITTHAVCFYLF